MPEIKREVDINIEITVRCYECDSDLEVVREDIDAWGDITTVVKPCECQLEESGDE